MKKILMFVFVLAMFAGFSNFAHAQCANQMGPNTQEIQNNDTLVQSGWGVNRFADSIYYAQIRVGFGNLSTLPWTTIPGATLTNECTGWIIVNVIPTSALQEGEKLQFRAFMQNPNGVKFASQQSTFIYHVGMNSTSRLESTSTMLTDLPSGINFGSITTAGEGKFDVSTLNTLIEKAGSTIFK